MNIKRKICVKGYSSLKGTIKVGGSKNAVLPILAATLITDEKCVIKNVPELADISIMISMLEVLGKSVYRRNGTVIVESKGQLNGEAPYDLVRKLRASVLVMGALSGRLHKVQVALPGGCAIGTRPIDLHLKGLKKMGAEIKVSEGFVKLSSRGLKGAVITLDYPSVGATENLITAAARAEGETIIENIALEPEVEQLVEFLKSMGVPIEAEFNTVKINGVKRFKPVEYEVSDDRIQAGTYLMAGCIKSSDIEIIFSEPEQLDSVLEKLIECGANIKVDAGRMRVKAPAKLRNLDIRTSPYPGFPTDLQAPLSALLTVADGVSVITEEVFENRFLHCPELMRMGADIEIKGKSAIISGVKKLSGAPVAAPDLRGGAALIIAALMAKGKTEISDIGHIERGYEDIVGKLKSLGAQIWIE